MTWFIWTILVLLALEIPAKVMIVGQPRKLIEAIHAASTAIVNGAFIVWGLWILWK